MQFPLMLKLSKRKLIPYFFFVAHIKKLRVLSFLPFVYLI